MATVQNYSTLFVCGCPRSGTTALWRLLSFHELIALGLERYVHRIFGNFSLNAGLFEEDRFFRVEKGDTFYTDLNAFNTYYSNLKKRFGNTILRGDKIPKLYIAYDKLLKIIPDAKLIFIVRNPFDVALSYNNRAKDSNDNTWRRNQDYSEAMKDWNQSVFRTLKALRSGVKIHCLEYESFFFNGADLERVFNYLDVGLTEAVCRGYAGLLTRSAELEEERRDGLSSKEKQYILLNAAVAQYRELLKYCA